MPWNAGHEIAEARATRATRPSRNLQRAAELFVFEDLPGIPSAHAIRGASSGSSSRRPRRSHPQAARESSPVACDDVASARKGLNNVFRGGKDHS